MAVSSLRFASNGPTPLSMPDIRFYHLPPKKIKKFLEEKETFDLLHSQCELSAIFLPEKIDLITFRRQMRLFPTFPLLCCYHSCMHVHGVSYRTWAPLSHARLESASIRNVGSHSCRLQTHPLLRDFLSVSGNLGNDLVWTFRQRVCRPHGLVRNLPRKVI